MKKSIFLFFAAILCAMSANAACYLKGSFNDWSTANEMAVSGTTATCTIDLAGNTTFEFKVNNGSDWYGSSSTVKSTATTITLNGGDNAKITTTFNGTYTFSFNTSTKKLTVTYPTEDKPVEKHDITVKAKYPATWNSGQAAIHFWGTGVTGTTPAAMTKDGDWWTYTVTGVPTTSSLSVIFINGSNWNGDKNQTVDITGITENTCFEVSQSGSAKGTAVKADCETGEGEVVETHDITVKAFYPAAWNAGKAAIHFWGDGVTGATPAAMTKDGDWWSYTVTGVPTTSELSVIFINGDNWNGDANQTVDITGITESTCYQITSGSGKATATAIDCESTPATPEPEPTELAYNVTVPAGTKACYICGNMTGWNFTEMTKVDDTHYTITIEGAKKTDEYKYASGSDWGYVEKDANGNEMGNRTYVDGNDVVARWASVYDPDAVEQELTYSVTVPEGTYACYIAMDTDPAQEGWEFNEMTKVDDTHYTFTRTGLKNKTYKYTSGPGWEYVELTAEDGNVADRTWAENDVVAKWTSVYNPTAPTYDYYIAGPLAGGWSATQMGMEKVAEGQYTCEFTKDAGDYQFKVTNGKWGNETDGFDCADVEGSYDEVSHVDGNVNVKLTATTTFTVKFDSNTKKITFGGLTPVTVTPITAYTVTVPAGTEKCYIVGAFAESNWNTFIEMDKVAGEDNKFTIEVGAGKKIAEATTVTEYKYARGEGWDNVEKDENGEEIGNRTWSDNDVVASWAAPAETHTYTVAGSATLFGEDWDNTINEMTLQDDGTYVWTATGVTLSESVEFKVIEDQNWDIAWPASNYVIEIGEDKANTPGIYDVNIYFNAAEAKADNTTGIYVVLTPATIEIAEYIDITMTDLQTEDYGGGILALMGSETEALGLSVMLFLNDYNGEDKEYQLNEQSYLAMVSGWMETELPFVSGSMTKSSDATYGDVFTGTVIVSMDDTYYGLNITMYKKPLPKIDLTITGANVVIDLWNGVKISTTHDSKPVLVEFSSFEYTANNKYYDAAFEMGDWDTDDTYFRAFAAEADVTISGNTLTLKGSFEAADAIYNLTISGAMPLVVTEGDNTNLLAQNGQTADAYITRTFESGNLYTVSFPFAMNETTTKNVFGSRVEVYEYTSLTEETDGLVLNFTKLSTPQIAAGTPYLVKPNKNAYGFGLSDVTISNAINTVTHTCASTTIAMEPVLTAAAKATTNGKTQYWLAEDNNLYNKSVNLKGLRAIFNVQTNKSNVRARAAFNENVETGVEDIITTDAPVKVIVNGQLIIIRDGEMYNVQGQLVK